MLTQFHESAQKAIVIAESLAFDLGHNNVGSEHMLLSFLKMKDCLFAKLLKEYNVDDVKIYDDIVRLFGEKDEQPFYMEYSDVVKNIMDTAISLSDSKVSLNTMCVALLMQKESVAYELLCKYHVPIEEIKDELSEEKTILHELNQIHELKNVNEYVKTKTHAYVGRKDELMLLSQTLCKKDKSNALIIGKAGVGKSALVEALAVNINNKDVVDMLRDKVIFELSLSSIVAGTKYRGEFEEKFKRILLKVMQAKNVILFIDEIHNVIGAGGAEGAIDASNILKPFLARNELSLIGATTLEEYYKYFEKDQAMNRRFSIIKLKENTKEETKEILLALKEQYESYHGITIHDERIDDIVSLSSYYLPSRVFPDKAIDVLDLSCVKTVFLKDNELKKKYIEKVVEELSGQRLDVQIDYEKIEEKMNKEIIGQEFAIHKLMTSLKSLSYYPHLAKPKGVYMFVGSSGIGKSETVIKLAKVLNRHLIRLDMSEYSEYGSASKIIGSSPGYVGYDQMTSLISELSVHPHSILLLDEVDKAHKSVLHLFLQVFDQGVLKDSQQRLAVFKDVIVIMTSNVSYQNQAHVGFKKLKVTKGNLKENFSEEFLNRIDEVIEFKGLSCDELYQILDIYSPIQLSKKQKEELLKDYDNTLGVRKLLTNLRKYIVSQIGIS